MLYHKFSTNFSIAFSADAEQASIVEDIGLSWKMMFVTAVFSPPKS